MCAVSVCQSVCLSRGSTRLHCAEVIRCSLCRIILAACCSAQLQIYSTWNYLNTFNKKVSVGLRWNHERTKHNVSRPITHAKFLDQRFYSTFKCLVATCLVTVCRFLNCWYRRRILLTQSVSDHHQLYSFLLTITAYWCCWNYKCCVTNMHYVFIVKQKTNAFYTVFDLLFSKFQ